MKTVFPTNRECCLAWSRQKQGYGSNRQKSIYFEGATIYSHRRCGLHFAIAMFAKDGRVVLFSVATSRHQSIVRSVIPAGVMVFVVPYLSVEPGLIRKNMDNYYRILRESVNKFNNAKRHKKFWLLENRRVYAEMLNYSRIFNWSLSDGLIDTLLIKEDQYQLVEA